MPSEKFPRPLIRRLEATGLPLEALDASRQVRAYLDRVEATAMRRARDLGASPADIARALGITRQAVYNKLRALDRRSATDETVVLPELEAPRPEG
jgi:DNA invertase Pin-like site-specific DNA recombinase